MLRALAISLALALPTAGAASAYFEPDYTPKPIADLLDFGARYDAAIPTPESVLGYQSGEIIFTPEMHAVNGMRTGRSIKKTRDILRHPISMRSYILPQSGC